MTRLRRWFVVWLSVGSSSYERYFWNDTCLKHKAKKCLLPSLVAGPFLHPSLSWKGTSMMLVIQPRPQGRNFLWYLTRILSVKGGHTFRSTRALYIVGDDWTRAVTFPKTFCLLCLVFPNYSSWTGVVWSLANLSGMGNNLYQRCLASLVLLRFMQSNCQRYSVGNCV